LGEPREGESEGVPPEKWLRGGEKMSEKACLKNRGYFLLVQLSIVGIFHNNGRPIAASHGLRGGKGKCRK